MDEFAAAAGVAQGGDDDVDLAALQFLQTIGAGHRRQPQRDADGFGEGAGDVDIIADEVSVSVAEAEGPVVGLDPGDQMAALPDLLEPVGRGRAGAAKPDGDGENDEARAATGTVPAGRTHGAPGSRGLLTMRNP